MKINWQAFEGQEVSSICHFASGDCSFTALRSVKYSDEARTEVAKLRKLGAVKAKKLAKRAVVRNHW